MKNRSRNLFVALALLALLTLNLPLSTAHAQGTAFTYQGQLQNNGGLAGGSYAMQFTLFATNATGVAIAGPVTNNAIAVTNGLFTTTVNFGPVFAGTNYWLDIAVSTNGTNFTELTPRQPLTPVPYAIFAETASNLSGSVSAAQVSGTIAATQLPASVVTNNASGLTLTGTFNGNGAGITNVNAAALNGLNATNFWQLGGNNVATGQFLGSTNFQPVQVLVNGIRALSLSPTTNNATHSNIVNVVGGSPANYVQPGIYGAVIAGGGAAYYTFTTAGNNYSNSVFSDMAFIGGGYSNVILSSATASVIAGGFGNSIQNGSDSVIGGGQNNSMSGNPPDSVIGGGSGNYIANQYSFIGGGYGNSNPNSGNEGTVIGGGWNNTANAGFAFLGGGYGNIVGLGATPVNALFDAVLVGGYENTIQFASDSATLVGGEYNNILPNSTYAFLGGGQYNTNGGAYSVVPGGTLNYAGGEYSFAAGQQAKANYQGDFVWADSQNAPFASTSTNQFLIRAQGGVGINENNPPTALGVNGTVTATNFIGSGAGLTNLQATNLTGTFPLSTLPATVVTNNEPAVTLGSLTLGGGLNLPAPASMSSGGVSLLYADNSDNTYLGMYAGQIGNNNTGIGYEALYVVSGYASGSNNTAIGVQALSLNNGSDNTANGYNALEGSSGSYNTANGYNALYFNGGAGSPGSGNTANGYDALFYNNGSYNTANGYEAMGGGSLFSEQTGDNNVADGAYALFKNSNGINNVAVGISALANSTTDNGLVAIGYQALQSDNALYVTSPGPGTVSGNGENTAIGYQSLQADTFGYANTAVGNASLLTTSTGYLNTALGDNALKNNTTGYQNTAVGNNALGSEQTGNNNIALGYNAGAGLGSGSNNIYLGNSGNSSESSLIRIGTSQTDAYLAGTVHASGGVNVDDNSQNTGTLNADALTFGSGSGSGEGIASKRIGGNDDDLEFYTGFNQWMTILHNGNVGIGTTNPSQTLEVNGNAIIDNSLTTASITITGGSDLAEPFKITSNRGKVPQGAVVVIDDQNPGHLKLSDSPYDVRVAGVVSGANGIHPGIQMHQQDLLEGGQNVALSGRVYVQADASNGAIRPGDMLTTSSTPGYAMKVTDHARAEGAILGKAMTSLNGGKGMVLLLVTLQ